MDRIVNSDSAGFHPVFEKALPTRRSFVSSELLQFGDIWGTLLASEFDPTKIQKISVRLGPPFRPSG